eukprot:m.253551 g.253551  ORF g.253551 m.253551 type:complete len:301 (+) comp26718_c0_seq24:1971-2873(+)
MNATGTSTSSGPSGSTLKILSASRNGGISTPASSCSKSLSRCFISSMSSVFFRRWHSAAPIAKSDASLYMMKGCSGRMPKTNGNLISTVFNSSNASFASSVSLNGPLPLVHSVNGAVIAAKLRITGLKNVAMPTMRLTALLSPGSFHPARIEHHLLHFISGSPPVVTWPPLTLRASTPGARPTMVLVYLLCTVSHWSVVLLAAALQFLSCPASVVPNLACTVIFGRHPRLVVLLHATRPAKPRLVIPSCVVNTLVLAYSLLHGPAQKRLLFGCLFKGSLGARVAPCSRRFFSQSRCRCPG